MNRFDWSDLDARLLQLLVAVVDAGSVTGAAVTLGVTQSAVSHQLDKLRAISGDALFVKSGRGIVATPRALEMASQARGLLEQLQAFARGVSFDPAQWRGTVTIAANDFQRELLLPALAVHLRDAAPGVALRVIPSAVPSLEMLRDGICDLAISPRPPDGSDILHKRLFEDRYRVFYDPAVRKPPRSAAQYLQADHITVVYEPNRATDLDRALAEQGIDRRFAVMLPGFASVPAFLRDSALLAAAPGLMARGQLSDFASVPMPLPCPTLPMYLIWHRRQHQDPAQRWLRAEVERLLPAAVGGRPIAAAQPRNS
jgi:DNA-binding transcriptional LysR family regulator